MRKNNLNVFFGGIVSCLVLIVLLGGCKTTSKTPQRGSKSNSGRTVSDHVTKSSDINGLLATMTGSFTSSAQAKDDTTYLDITLHMYPIWISKESKYLYVEQSVTAEPDKPYRQRIYRLVADGNGGFENHIYTLKDSELFIGKWSDSLFFDGYTEDLLEEKDGCTVYLSKHADGSYSGSTRMDHCKSNMEGASYATSLVKLRENSIMSWDQGFDAAGVQVWGTEKGGYRFIQTSTK